MGARPAESQHSYLAIADSLRIEIETGRFGPGDKLPTARELMAQHGVATHTVTSALKVLQDEGLTYSVHGRGTFVRDDLDVSNIRAQQSTGPDTVELEKTVKVIAESVHRIETELGEMRQELAAIRQQMK